LFIGLGELLPSGGRAALSLLPIGLGLGLLLLLPLTKGARVMGDPLTVTVLVFKDAFGFGFGFRLGLGLGLELGFGFGFKFRSGVRVGAMVRWGIWVGGLVTTGADITNVGLGPTVGSEVSNEVLSVSVVKPGNWMDIGAAVGSGSKHD
jgi:hypothetical protein